MGTEKTSLLPCESIYCINNKADTEETYFHFLSTWPKDETVSHEIPGRLWESVGADIFTIDNKCYLHIVDYHSKFPIIEEVEGFGAENRIKICKIFFRIWTDQKNGFRCEHKLHIREVWKLLQETSHTSCSIIIIQSSKQLTGKGMNKICQKNYEKILWD